MSKRVYPRQKHGVMIQLLLRRIMTGAITVKNDHLDNADDENKSNNYSSDCCHYFPNCKNCYNGETHGDVIIGKKEKENRKNNMTYLIMIVKMRMLTEN